MDKAKLHIAARARKNNEGIMFKPKAGWVIGYGLRQAMLGTPIENSGSCPRNRTLIHRRLFYSSLNKLYNIISYLRI